MIIPNVAFAQVTVMAGENSRKLLVQELRMKLTFIDS
jgi:hypothetical protein